MGYTLEDALGAPPREFLKIWTAPMKFAALAFQRRMVEDQLRHNKKVSVTDMKKQMGWLSYAAMGVGAIIATGIFSFMPYIYANITGPAVVLSLIVASVTAAASALIYSEFAVEYPVVGGGFVYVLNTFGEYPAVLCATNLVIDYVFGTSAVVRNFSVYFSQLINKKSDIFQKDVSFQKDDIDYLALIIVIFLTCVVIWSTKVFDESNILLQVAHVGLVCFTFIAAFTKANTENWQPFFPKGCPEGGIVCPTDGSILPPDQGCVDNSFGPAGARRIVTGASNIFFVFIGYDVIALGAEEAKTNYSVPIGMLGSVVFVTIIYILMASSLIMLFPFSGLACKDENVRIAGFAYAFVARGMSWAKYIVAAGACIGIFTSCGIGIYGLSRIFQVFAREGMLPAFVGQVNSLTYTPIVAVAIAGIVSALMAFFTGFETLANMTSIGTLTMYWFVAISHLYRRYAPEFETPEVHGDRHLSIPFQPNVFGALGVTVRRIILLFYIFMLSASAIGFTIYWNLETGSTWLIICPCVWLATVLAIIFTMPIQYVPAKFSIPWWALPWVPAISIWANVMLVGGFGARKDDYYRLFGAMAIGTVIYLLYGVHASYWRFYGGGRQSELPMEYDEKTDVAQ